MEFFWNYFCQVRRPKIDENFRKSYQVIYENIPVCIQPIRVELERTLIGRLPEARYVLYTKAKDIQVNDEIFAGDREYIVLEVKDWGSYLEVYLKEKK